MARFSAETVRLAKQELDESLARMQQTAKQLARRGEHAERSARAEQTAAGEKCRQMQQQLDQVRELMVQNQAALYRLEDGLGSAFRRREAALCREKAAQEALEEAQRQYRAAKAMPLPAENDPSYAFLEQGRRNALKQGARQIADAQERIRTARQEAEELAVQMGDAAPVPGFPCCGSGGIRSTGADPPVRYGACHPVHGGAPAVGNTGVEGDLCL